MAEVCEEYEARRQRRRSESQSAARERDMQLSELKWKRDVLLHERECLTFALGYPAFDGDHEARKKRNMERPIRLKRNEEELLLVERNIASIELEIRVRFPFKDEGNK